MKLAVNAELYREEWWQEDRVEGNEGTVYMRGEEKVKLGDGEEGIYTEGKKGKSIYAMRRRRSGAGQGRGGAGWVGGCVWVSCQIGPPASSAPALINTQYLSH